MFAGVKTGGARIGASVASRSGLSATLVVAAGVLVFHAALQQAPVEHRRTAGSRRNRPSVSHDVQSRGLRTQNSFPSGSASTTQVCSPCPTSAGDAPTPRILDTSAAWSSAA